VKTWDVAIENIEKLPEKVVRGTVLGMFSRIVKRSPVDTGRFRGNWQITIDAPATGQLGADKGGGRAIAAATSVAQGQRFPANAYFITNNMPYGEKLEFGGYPTAPKNPTGKTQGGFSAQAPSGMVRVSIAEFEKVIKEAAAKV
tara:strand:- start:1760 stop:2191 length:432 start_codon:yes stop_codon:yes gene_type:complete